TTCASRRSTSAPLFWPPLAPPSNRNSRPRPRVWSRNRKRRAPRSIATRPPWPARLCRAYSAGLLSNNGARDSGMVSMFRAACELKRKLRTALFAAFWLSYAPAAFASAFAGDQEHAPASAQQAEHANPAQPGHEAEGGHDQSIGGGIRRQAWRVATI